MDAQALKLDIQQALASVSDPDILSQLKRLLGMVIGPRPELVHGGSILKEPEPIPLLRAEVKRLVDLPAGRQVRCAIRRC